MPACWHCPLQVKLAPRRPPQSEIREKNKGEISFSNHISNKKSAINSKTKLAGVAKHNLRKYHSQDYSRDNITLLYGTTNLMQDVKNVYRKEFDAALHEYNAKQTRPERRIDDYFEHVTETEQDMSV